MLALTWFGYLPGRRSQNIWENPNTPPEVKKAIFRRDMESIHRGATFESLNLRNLYMVRRIALDGVEAPLTWIAKCESVDDGGTGRLGSYRGVGIWLGDTCLEGAMAVATLGLLLKNMATAIPARLPAYFDFAAETSKFKEQNEHQAISQIASELEHAEKRLLPHAGLGPASGRSKTCVFDLRDCNESPKIIGSCLDRIQCHPNYRQYGDVYLTADRLVLEKAPRIIDSRIVKPGWEDVEAPAGNDHERQPAHIGNPSPPSISMRLLTDGGERQQTVPAHEPPRQKTADERLEAIEQHLQQLPTIIGNVAAGEANDRYRVLEEKLGSLTSEMPLSPELTLKSQTWPLWIASISMAILCLAATGGTYFLDRKTFSSTEEKINSLQEKINSTETKIETANKKNDNQQKQSNQTTQNDQDIAINSIDTLIKYLQNTEDTESKYYKDKIDQTIVSLRDIRQDLCKKKAQHCP